MLDTWTTIWIFFQRSLPDPSRKRQYQGEEDHDYQVSDPPEVKGKGRPKNKAFHQKPGEEPKRDLVKALHGVSIIISTSQAKTRFHVLEVREN